jgi:hypothetical protein
MAGEPQLWREGPYAVPDTRVRSLSTRRSFAKKLFPQMPLGGLDKAVVPELPCRGPTNTEPGAVATGSAAGGVHRDCKLDKMKMLFIASPTRSLPTHTANRPGSQIPGYPIGASDFATSSRVYDILCKTTSTYFFASRDV